MPNIKETIDIIKHTPDDQAIMLIGKHGVGKSQCITSTFKKKGYRIITLFVGQMADAGDFTGLPERTSLKVSWTNEDGEEQIEDFRVTDFCAPKWWPFDPNEKVLIFLDETNRGKPEIMQCLMDMVLNRKLNGRKLPSKTKVVSAINPMEDGYYQVEQLDPAFMDRFNVYNFEPSTEEWIYYAAESGFHKPVIEFVAKNDTFLDPPNTTGENAEARADAIYPSRRSWERVSDFMKSSPNINKNTLKNYLFGVIGIGATVEFVSFLDTIDKGINPGLIITDWNEKIANTIKTYNIAQIIFLNNSIGRWFESNIDSLSIKSTADKCVGNLKKYLDTISPDAMAHFWGELSSAESSKKKWPSALISADPSESLVERYLEIRQGKVSEEEDLDWD